MEELRERQLTPQGRAKLRERTAVEPGALWALAHVGYWQGDRARYRGVRKNLLDLRRTAVVHNLHVIARHEAATAKAASFLTDVLSAVQRTPTLRDKGISPDWNNWPSCCII
jgi:hypothetical protein